MHQGHSPTIFLNEGVVVIGKDTEIWEREPELEFSVKKLLQEEIEHSNTAHAASIQNCEHIADMVAEKLADKIVDSVVEKVTNALGKRIGLEINRECPNK